MSAQYERNSILRYERVFGENYVSTGGAELTEELLGNLDLGSSPRVLDIGGGLGGAAFLLEESHGAAVTGIDLSPLMVELAQERASTREAKSEFRVADALTVELEPDAYDLVWSRDTFLHIANKSTLFERIARWLKPGAEVIVTDYARNDAALSESFQRYVADSGYDLRDVDGYAQIVRDAGFQNVEARDWTPRFATTLEQEAAKLRANRESFLTDFSQEDYDYLLDRWERKIAWCAAGDMRNIRLSATAPT